jgi:hypothetical protein
VRHHGSLAATRANLLGANDEVGAAIFAAVTGGARLG